MTDLYPYIPLGVDLRLTIGITSYAGQLAWGVTGDRDSVPDLQVLCDGSRRPWPSSSTPFRPPPSRQAHHA